MKRTYIAPEALVIKMTTEDAILSLSGELSAGGGDNVTCILSLLTKNTMVHSRATASSGTQKRNNPRTDE